MFLDLLQRYNPSLLNFALDAIKSKLIEPDTYIIDTDAVQQNALLLLQSAERHNILLYGMLKQLGHNPRIARLILDSKTSSGMSFAGIVAVDFREAQHMHKAKLPVKHIGHLVQIPDCHIEFALSMNPDVITVYSIEKARRIGIAAKENRRIQNILLRITASEDEIYAGQECGFAPEEIPLTLEKISALDGIRFAGITSFPCFLYKADLGKAVPTANAHTLQKVADMLKTKYGSICSHINMPSCNSPATIPLIAQLGGTHAEPGHSLTGTNPDNLDAAAPLIPALAYATEVSHVYKGKALCFGGGYYRRSNVLGGIIKTRGIDYAAVIPPDLSLIDYHFMLDREFPIGSPVCMAFRTQIFVTRSHVALVKGLSAGKPILDSLWDSQGNLIGE